jgi:cytoskeletal protein RodZ
VGEFGDKFRKAREAKGISLDDVSNVTKISSRMLQAIEQERFDQLPGGVFNKGFIRAYAKHLGLNDEVAVTDYLVCLRQAQVDAHEVWEPERPTAPRPTTPRPAAPGPAALGPAARGSASPEKRAPQPYAKPSLTTLPPVEVEDELPDLQLPRAEDVRPPRRDYAASRESGVPWNIVAVAAVVFVITAFVWIRHSRKAHTETGAVVAPTQPAVVQPASTAVAAAMNSNSASQPPAQAKPAQSAAGQPMQSAATAHSSAPASAKSPANADSNGQPKNQSIATVTNPSSDVTIRSFAPAAPATPPAARMTLVIRASETSWVSVTTDGQATTQETLIAPAATTVRATREIVARIGNAAGVSFLWNGEEIPARGDESEVKTFIFDAQGMRVVPSTPSANQNR